ncbi:hypothetical protein [uncultured Herbaspirillum sp.]|uniref:hypothetical protein n=1 Tax=uncultured Herbaspirillum sp. TaxID=160236 RepID=UPI0025878D27|nr:hypothetical protein [uncultured Herbaspirillum sp.]
MKSNLRASFLFLCCTAALITCTQTALAVMPPIPIKLPEVSAEEIWAQGAWKPPFPFTPDDIQQKLIQVLRTPADDLSKEKIEKIFDMTIQNSEKLDPASLNADGRWYKVFSHATVDWYFGTGITVVPKASNFGFDWWGRGRYPYPYVVPMCLDARSLSDKIASLNLGWIEKKSDPFQTPHLDAYLFYRKEGERISINYLPFTRCMTLFSFSVRTNH